MMITYEKDGRTFKGQKTIEYGDWSDEIDRYGVHYSYLQDIVLLDPDGI